MGNKIYKKIDHGEEFIRQYPKLGKWINECLCCHKKGYKPDMPDKITVVESSLEVYFIKKYFKPLSLNSNGLCSQCENVLKSTYPKKDVKK